MAWFEGSIARQSFLFRLVENLTPPLRSWWCGLDAYASCLEQQASLDFVHLLNTQLRPMMVHANPMVVIECEFTFGLPLH
jgi:hypothetical protein